MTSKNAKLLKAMEILGVRMAHFREKDTEGFKTRFRFQKYVYILQSIFDLSVGSYNLYLRGPYSPAVAETGFELAKLLESGAMESIEFAPITEKKLNAIKELFEPGDDLTEEDKLEAWTTYHYIKTLYPDGTPPEDRLIKDLESYKSWVREKEDVIKEFLQRANGVLDSNGC